MKKILYILNYASREERRYQITSFSRSAYLAARKLGFEFHINTNTDEVVAANKDDTVRYHVVEIYRNPFSREVLKAKKQLDALLEREKFDIIHCNTPIGGFLGRICGKKHGVKKVIYQAHGFHFYKGAPLKNWMLYYPIEKWLARYTDAMITINHEDHELANRRMKLRNGGSVYYVPGVGITTDQYMNQQETKEKKRFELGLSTGDIACISMGDLVARKNYGVAIRAVAETGNRHLHYFICGNGPKEKSLIELAKKLNISSQVHFLGFRSDINELLAAADIFLFTTRQEGLPRSMMEAMASGLPCIASRIRGNTDLVQNGSGGFLCDLNNSREFAQKINILATDSTMRERMGRYNMEAIQKFSSESVTSKMISIYELELD